MRYAAAEKLEIIRLVEQSPLPVRNADYVPWSKLLAKAIDKAESVAELEALLTDNPPHIAADDEIYPAAGAGIQRRSRSDLA